MQRVLVVGMSGAGKTTAAREIAARRRLPLHDMDALALGPGWSTPPGFIASVERIIAGPRWVFDSWGYPDVRDAMWAAADTIVWLDYPFRVVISRLVRRSLTRTISRAELFGGNRETWRGWLSRDHPLWSAVTTFWSRRAYLAERTTAASSAHLRTVRLTGPAEFRSWLERDGI